jgi:hypothetical protein
MEWERTSPVTKFNRLLQQNKINYKQYLANETKEDNSMIKSKKLVNRKKMQLM